MTKDGKHGILYYDIAPYIISYIYMFVFYNNQTGAQSSYFDLLSYFRK